jgi:hypothetical protein
MSRNYENLRRMWDTRWTPNTRAFRYEVQLVIDEAGGIGMLGEIIGIRPRHIRRIIRGHVKAVSFRVADQIFARSERSIFMYDLPWYTVDEMQEMRIWNPPFGKYIRDIPEAYELEDAV